MARYCALGSGLTGCTAAEAEASILSTPFWVAVETEDGVRVESITILFNLDEILAIDDFSP